MKYKKIRPPGYLKDYIRYFWTLESALPKTFEPIADGCPGLIFQQTENGTFYDQNNIQMKLKMKYAVFFRNVNLGRPNNPSKAQLESAFKVAGAISVESFLTNGNVVFAVGTEQRRARWR